MIIGEWIEAEPRELRNSPSTYAADWETLRTHSGRYPVRLTRSGFGDWTPESADYPYWLMVNIDADRIAGAVYSGFAGVNFASRDLPCEPKPYYIQANAYNLIDWLDAGKIELSEAGALALAPHIERWRASAAKLAREAVERETVNKALRARSVYLSLRASGFSETYARDLAQRQYGEPEPSADDIALGDRLYDAERVSMGAPHADRFALLCDVLSGFDSGARARIDAQNAVSAAYRANASREEIARLAAIRDSLAIAS